MDYATLLNKEQFLPVTTTEGQVLVLAGAGSGKTRVLTYRIAFLLEHCQVSPYNILAITFTNKATAEMKQRIFSLTNIGSIWVSTFHSLCSRVLREDIDKIGYGKNFTIYTADDSDRLVTRIMKGLGLDDKNLKYTVQWHIANAKNNYLTPEKYSESCTDDKAELILRIYSEYEKELKKANALDFDDLLVKTIKLFSEHEDVLAKYQNRFKYIHVDEFQDTNKLQYLIVKMLAMKWRNIFVVGDDDQSIYGWRGAEIENILNFKKVYPDCNVFKLEQNYRSSGNILKCANAVIAKNNDRTGKTLWTQGGDGAKVVYNSCYDDRSEADYVLKQITGLCAHNDYKYGDFVILTRANSLSRVFEEKLNLYGIPYRIYGGFKFFDRKEVKDVLAYLRMLSNPQDTEAVLRIINFPKRNIGEAAVQNFARACAEYGVGLVEGVMRVDSMDIPPVLAKKIGVFAAVVKDFRDRQSEMPLGAFAEYLIKSLKFDEIYDVDIDEDASKLQNIAELATSIKMFEKDNPESGLDEFLQSVALISDTDNIAEDNFITIATVHAVKGLEFKCVFIVGCEEKIFPNSRAVDDPSEMPEERRVMYVALTRAKERLYITNSQSRFRFGKYENNLASRFIKECGLVIEADERQRREGATGVNKTEYKPNAGSYLNNSGTTASANPRANLAAYGKNFAATSKIISANDKDISVFKAGMTVLHKTFGEGKIIQVNGEVAHIGFERLGVKQFNLKLAPIEIK